MADDAVRVFISYSHRDEHLRQQLDKHLAPLKWQKVIESWHDRQIQAGMEWADKIDDNLNRSDIILLLVSPDFVASDYCFKIELHQAITRHEAGEAIVVPVILEPCDWSWLPFAKFQAFPKDAKAISTWTNSNEAFLDVATGIRKVAQELFAKRKVLAEQKQANRERYLQKVEEVLSDGMISIVERDTLDELGETLGLTSEEAKEIETRAYEPYSRVEENLNKYKKTLTRLVEKGYYPFNEEIEKDLENRQRDLGLKPEDAARISKPIFDQAELDYQTKKKQLTEAEKLQALEQQRQQEQKEYEAKLERYRQEFSRAVQAEYPLSQQILKSLKTYQQQLELKDEDITHIEQPLIQQTELQYQQKLRQEVERQRQEAEELKRQQVKAERLRQEELERQRVLEQQRREKMPRRQAAQTSSANELASEKGVDYTRLQDLLKAGQWKEANEETTKLMSKWAGQPYAFTVEHIKDFPCTDLRTIDQLWVKHSQGRFGFSVQKKIWQDYGSPTSLGEWDKFGEEVGWKKKGFFSLIKTNANWQTESELTFDTSAPNGHIPCPFPHDFGKNYHWGGARKISRSTYDCRLVDFKIP
jgi:hypothetical protein